MAKVTFYSINSTELCSLGPPNAVFSLSSLGETDSVYIYLLFPSLILIPPSLLLLVSPRAVRPRLWRERRRVMFGLSSWLLVSVSGAAGSCDSAGGAAGPSRVQPSPCDTLSVTDPLRLVTWHPLLLLLHPRLWPPLHSTPPTQASGLFTATLQSVTHLLPH